MLNVRAMTLFGKLPPKQKFLLQNWDKFSPVYYSYVKRQGIPIQTSGLNFYVICILEISLYVCLNASSLMFKSVNFPWYVSVFAQILWRHIRTIYTTENYYSKSSLVKILFINFTFPHINLSFGGGKCVVLRGRMADRFSFIMWYHVSDLSFPIF